MTHIDNPNPNLPLGGSDLDKKIKELPLVHFVYPDLSKAPYVGTVEIDLPLTSKVRTAIKSLIKAELAALRVKNYNGGANENWKAGYNSCADEQNRRIDERCAEL